MPGGRRLLYVSNKEGSRDIYEIHLDASGKPSGPAARLTTGLDAFTISLSQGTGKFAYAKFNYNANIWSVGIPSGQSTALADAKPVTTGSQTVEGMDVSPDGQVAGLRHQPERQSGHLQAAAGGGSRCGRG